MVLHDFNNQTVEEIQQKCLLLSHVRLFVTPWTVACQALPEHWGGLPFPSPGDLPDLGSNPGLPHYRQTLYSLSHQELWGTRAV